MEEEDSPRNRKNPVDINISSGSLDFYENSYENEKKERPILPKRSLENSYSRVVQGLDDAVSVYWEIEELAVLTLKRLLETNESTVPRGRDTSKNNRDMWEWRLKRGKQWSCLRRVCRMWKKVADSQFNFAYSNNFAINLALFKSCIDSVKFLLKQPGTDEVLYDPKVFVSAAQFGHTELVEFLLTCRGVNPNLNRPLSSACRSEHLGVVRAILRDTRVDATQYHEDFQSACKLGRFKVVKCFLNHGKLDPSLEGSKAFLLACRHGNSETVQVLLEDDRIDPKVNHSQCIVNAVEKGDSAMVSMLLKDGRANPASRENLALRTAVKKGNEEIIAMLQSNKRVQRKSSGCSLG
eukprot:TRINITY_DN2653_c0_g1_i1.p1 TRINITY_DN2653_c0_g1~~TRINITY_DN2653_c0_g1_i1.p1  ORF type:complete len:389 (+),score=86.00 TRINITY_DN2653_c0_g1_i1:113-1168(+)